MAPAATKSKKVPVKKTQKTVAEKATETGSKRKRVSVEAPNKKKTPAAPKKTAKKEESSDDEEEVVASKQEEEDDDEELTEEQEEALRKEILGDIASSSEGEDSSDEEADGIDKNESVVALDGKKLDESKAETKEAFDKKKAAKSTKSTKAEEEKGVVYLGRIPHGFYEKEMRGYFSQFGDITRLRLSRNKKTGKPKHYAFIEFQSREVAEIVAETMDNYLLFSHMLRCQVVPPEKVHEKLFNGSNAVYKPFNYELRNRQIHNKRKTPEQLEAKRKQLQKTENKLREAIKDAGIDYDFPSFT